METQNLDNYPFVTSFLDRHGKKRYRYRRKHVSRSIPGHPNTPEFDEKYQSIVEGRETRRAIVKNHPRAAKPKSLRAAWNGVQTTAAWRGYDPATKYQNTRLATDFLESLVTKDKLVKWGEIKVEEIRHKHIKQILNSRADTPHAAKHWLTVLRKMILFALDEDWIEADPSARISWSPQTKGWRAWTSEELNTYFQRWPVGTTPHLIACIAFWMGNRREDVAKIRWDQRTTRTLKIRGETRIVSGFEFRQSKKSGKFLFIPEAPMLTTALAQAPRIGTTVVVTQAGKPFSGKSLTGRMRDWTHSAGIEQGCTLHGLRKTLGKLLAEGGASTRQLMDVLGHSNIEHAELYSRDADQAIMAVEGMDRAISLFSERG